MFTGSYVVTQLFDGEDSFLQVMQETFEMIRFLISLKTTNGLH